MARLIVEDGTGVLRANSYAGLAYSYSYLMKRNRVAAWIQAGIEEQEAALIAATDYIDKRFGRKFLGFRQFTGIPTPGTNMAILTENPEDGDQFLVGLLTYTFRDNAVSSTDVQIGADVAASAAAMAQVLTAGSLISAQAAGAVVEMETVEFGAGEPIEITSMTPRISFEYEYMHGGSEFGGTQPLEFPRSAFNGIPDCLKMATVEYATRALLGPLAPDPETDPSGSAVRRRSEKVGPVEEEIVFQNSRGDIFKTYPEADLLMRPLINGNGGTYR